MLLLLTFITIVFAGFIYFLKREIMDPAVIFNGIWSVILFLFDLQLFKTISISNITIGILYCMILSFNMGYIFCNILRSSKKNKFAKKTVNNKEVKKEYYLNEKIFLVLSSITIIVMFIDEIGIIGNLLKGVSFEEIMSGTGKLTVSITGSFKVFLYMFIVHPMSYVISPICAIQVLKNKKKKYLILNLIITFLNVAHHGGRIAIFIFLISYYTVYKLLQSNKENKVKFRTKLKYFVALIIFGNIIMSLSTSRGIDEIWLSFYAYLICCIPLSTIYITSYITPFVGKTFGNFSFHGFTYPIFSILNYFGIESSKSYLYSREVRYMIEHNYVSIGNYSATGINNFISAGTYPYVDGGYIFEFLLIFLLSVAICNVYNKFKITNSEKHLAIYVLCVIGIAFSFMSLLLQNYSYANGLLIIILCLFKRKKELVI